MVLLDTIASFLAFVRCNTDSARNDLPLVLADFVNQPTRTIDTLVSPLTKGPTSRRVSVEEVDKNLDTMAPSWQSSETEPSSSSEYLARILLSPALVTRTPNDVVRGDDSLVVKLSSGSDFGTRRRPLPSPCSKSTRIQALFPSRPMLATDYECLDAMIVMLCRNAFLRDACKQFHEQQSMVSFVEHFQVFCHPFITSLTFHAFVPQLAAPSTVNEDDTLYLDVVLLRIQARQYVDCRTVLDDLCRVFDQTREAFSRDASTRAPSFIMAHLKAYVVTLWQEFMLPSDTPIESDPLFPLYDERDLNRRRQLQDSALLPLNQHILTQFCDQLGHFMALNGRLDAMDLQDLPSLGTFGDFESKLKQLVAELSNLSQQAEFDYQFETLHRDLMSCVPETTPQSGQIKSRLSRFFWKLGGPIHEANCRGADASCIWGDAANTLWAREGPRRPYWPALCLGVLVPPEKQEPWQPLITARNEARLPSDVAAQLATMRKICEVSIRKEGGSFFLVELLGIHEFRWVASEDVFEYEEGQDPNNEVAGRCTDRRHKQLLPVALREVDAAASQYAAALESIFE